jgi:diguanylate cyclase
MPYSQPSADSGGSRFVRYTCAMRLLGTATSTMGVAASLHAHGASPAWWPLLVFTGLGWPWLAWRISRNSSAPVTAEFRNLVIDAGVAGFWIAIMRFDLLPSVLLASVMAMDRTVAGGWPLARRSMAVMAAVCLVTAALNGFAFEPRTEFTTMLWCMPFLVLYLLAIGVSARLFADKVRAQKRVLEKVVRIDAETGLATRQQWLARVAEQVRRFHRYGAVSSLLMIDVDEFKRVNDSLGHAAGDQVLRQVSAQLLQAVRSADAAGRYGGDEFGVLLPGTDGRAAQEVAERLRERVAAQVAAAGRPVTVSIGVAEIRSGMDGTEEWAAAADEALYRAKAAGRNRVSF